MQVIKFIGLFFIFIISSFIGLLYSKKYSNRVRDLEEMKNGLNIFKTKIQFTYKPIPDVFEEVSKSLNNNVGKIFLSASKYMQNMCAESAWIKGIEEGKSNTSFSKADVGVIKELSKMLGSVDLNGQVNSIEMIDNFLNSQLNEAEAERRKNEKLYKTLGASIGLVIAIVLI